jgi:hypothetical protein
VCEHGNVSLRRWFKENQILKFNSVMKIGQFSFGVGDRFGHQGEAQLRALMKANAQGIEVVPVWNKSNREHNTIHSEPVAVRLEADAAVKALGWGGQYCVDADHINLTNVDRFVDVSDFFTLDVATYIGNPSSDEEVAAFIESCKTLGPEIKIAGIDEPIVVTEALLKEVAGKFLMAIKEAGKIYRHIESVKGKDNFITEVSMDDYVGDTAQFAREFEADLMVIDYAVEHFGLPKTLKLSVHSGSDKFTIYPIMADLIKKHGKGLHIKTAGTTWLEEVIGLSLSGDDALAVAKEIYAKALARKEELCAPYADVIDIDDSKLPAVTEVESWDGEKFANTLRHIPGHPDYNANFRQLIHVGYKVAAELGDKYINLLEKYSEVIGKCVEENIYDRHLKRLFNL